MLIGGDGAVVCMIFSISPWLELLLSGGITFLMGLGSSVSVRSAERRRGLLI